MECEKALALARQARKEDNTEDAKRFYDMVRMEDPENGEAKFFYHFYALYEGKNAEIAGRFSDLCKILDVSLRLVSQSEEPQEKKLAIVRDIVETFTPETWSLNRYMNKLTVGTGSNTTRVLSSSDISSVSSKGMKILYELGDIVVKYFGQDRNPEAMKIAVIAWKEAVSLSQKWYAYAEKGKAEEYAAKIKEIEPGYEMPKKAGCISLADKKD